MMTKIIALIASNTKNDKTELCGKLNDNFYVFFLFWNEM